MAYDVDSYHGRASSSGTGCLWALLGLFAGFAALAVAFGI